MKSTPNARPNPAPAGQRRPAVEAEELLHLLVVGAKLLAAGYRPGLPAHVLAETVAADSAAVARMRCPRCRKRGMRYMPHRNDSPAAGRSGYRVLACCPHCGRAEEV